MASMYSAQLAQDWTLSNRQISGEERRNSEKPLRLTNPMILTRDTPHLSQLTKVNRDS